MFANPDIICLSHLRWSFVYQRPQHLMSRYARSRRVFFVEEAVREEISQPYLSVNRREGVVVMVPRVPVTFTAEQTVDAQRDLLDEMIAVHGLSSFILWYYTPAALTFSDHLQPVAVVYDCMDELSAFRHAAPELPVLEKQLIRRADVMFTGGYSLFDAKRDQHPNIHALPSSVDVEHFATARRELADPADQSTIGAPRLGYFGVIDERLDLSLLAGVAEARPDWQLVLIGPVVKIDPAELPRLRNIHYLGGKSYDELPRYIAGWDVAVMWFARNEATRFISPTKTPEYLAAGKPVVSTSIADVVRTYGGASDVVTIADSVSDFVQACQRALSEPQDGRRKRADALLRGMSWDRTWSKAAALVAAVQDVTPRPAASGEIGLGA